MDKHEALLKLAKTDDESIFIKKIIDKATRTSNYNFISETNFLDPGQISIVESIVNTLKNVDVIFDGGFHTSERKLAIFLPNEYFKDSYQSKITILKIVSSRFSKKLNHRDYLGSLLGAGIKREIIGDIIITDDNYALSCIVGNVKNHIFGELTQVGREHIKIEEFDLNQLSEIDMKQDYIEEFITVSALRLDSIIVATFKISRNEASSLIKQKKVKVNYRVESSTHSKLEENSLISTKGFGRCKIVSLLGETKKGRLRIKMQIYR